MKKMKIQEFNQDYMMIDEKEMCFEEAYPTREQSDYILSKISHPEIKEYNIKYSADSTDINLGEIGKYRLDGVPCGFNAFIITIEMEE
ncbi:hypothetical protein LHA31_10415 [Carnobacterium viridans]|uniref:Uncharacterized protein n=1 Tax=Carnobacterium viridans TaxID=174587 RepID=A0A1H0YSZ2_9LACT|nr:hypothetical protein [Carnobacterium viridans]UDE94958.1 hypothetical protein LHA31_10415 [Carnobacterium viridans]SDQ02743.1 hypothetical protein SAMN04487752_0275 [Carnobacterium viridans]SDQ18352.1 hypothetical protein SAMN04487752_1140 [Carnobacterium viridans]